jgi:hypothetical protein
MSEPATQLFTTSFLHIYEGYFIVQPCMCSSPKRVFAYAIAKQLGLAQVIQRETLRFARCI